jgi:hypothetical protein
MDCNLNQDILLVIATNLSVRNRIQMCRVCRYWHNKLMDIVMEAFYLCFCSLYSDTLGAVKLSKRPLIRSYETRDEAKAIESAACLIQDREKFQNAVPVLRSLVASRSLHFLFSGSYYGELDFSRGTLTNYTNYRYARAFSSLFLQSHR